MPRAKKKNESPEVITAALQLFAQKGYSNVTLGEIAHSAGMELSTVRSHFATKEEVLHGAFRKGQRDMEVMLRQPVTGDLNAHLEVLFDGLMEAVRPWGPELFLGMLYQATKDNILNDNVKKYSEKMNFAVKAFLAQMVAMSIVEQIQEVEKVNRELVSSFVESLAATLEGKKLADIKKAWVKGATRLIRPSPLTNVP